MHETSTWHMQDCVSRFVIDKIPAGRVLEVGSATARGAAPSYRTMFEKLGWSYAGLDLSAAANVDIVAVDPFSWNIESNSFDLVISGNMLEHNTMFWISILEMARVLRPDGLMIHIAPSRGYEHRTPMDCWRFYRDGMEALADWAGLDCIESTTDWAQEDLDKLEVLKPKIFADIPRKYLHGDGAWGDTVGVFRKPTPWLPKTAIRYMSRYLETSGAVSRASEPTATSAASDLTPLFAPPVLSDWTEVALHGIRMEIPDKLLTPTIRKAIKQEKYDHLKVRQVRSLLSPNDRLLELGAGVGFISAFASTRVRLASCVLVEANPELIPVIRRTHELNGSQCVVINAAPLTTHSQFRAQGTPSDQTSYYVTRNFWGSSLVAKTDAISVISAPVVDINELIRAHAPTVLVCDVEGAEADLLEGADLAGIRLLLVSVHTNILGEPKAARLREGLEERGLVFDAEHSVGSAAVFVRPAARVS